MSVNGVNVTKTGSVYDAYETKGAEKTAGETAAVKEETTDKQSAAVYEKSGTTEKKATYSINKMSAGDRASLVKQLQADMDSRKQSLVNLVQSMMGKQAKTAATADDSIWRFLAKGDFTVDAATKAQAQKDISEDGYWGVKQTSQRLFDFASALAGDDVDKMKEMQKAMEKGFKLATKSWGQDLPGICNDTMAAANKLFDDYYASKQTVTE